MLAHNLMLESGDDSHTSVPRFPLFETLQLAPFRMLGFLTDGQRNLASTTQVSQSEDSARPLSKRVQRVCGARIALVERVICFELILQGASRQNLGVCAPLRAGFVSRYAQKVGPQNFRGGQGCRYGRVVGNLWMP